MGEGDQVREHQAGVIPPCIFINSVPIKAQLTLSNH